MEIFAHHTTEHTITSNMYYFAIALLVVVVAWVVDRSTK